MQTISLVQIYTLLTQVMGEKVNAGDNSPVEVLLNDRLNEPFPITGVAAVRNDDGKIVEVHILTDFA